MDLEEDDLFAVFDSDASKTATSGAASLLHNKKEEDAAEDSVKARPVKFDTGKLVAEICGGSTNKRTKPSEDATAAAEEEEGVKKMKTEGVAVTLMTGISDQEAERTLKGESDWETQVPPPSRG
jgi:hypothetical protein